LQHEADGREAQVRAVCEMLDEARKHGDAWHEQGERLALAPPQRRSWWPWRRSA
jgi:hypothetical protein